MTAREKSLNLDVSFREGVEERAIYLICLRLQLLVALAMAPWRVFQKEDDETDCQNTRHRGSSVVTQSVQVFSSKK